MWYKTVKVAKLDSINEIDFQHQVSSPNVCSRSQCLSVCCWRHCMLLMFTDKEKARVLWFTETTSYVLSVSSNMNLEGNHHT